MTLATPRGRGVGRSTLDKHKRLILRSWRKHGPKPIELKHTIFRGAKTSISVSHNGEAFNRSEQYGQWVPRVTRLSWNPEPKRPFHTQSDGRLSTWTFKQSQHSAAYNRMITPPDVQAMIDYKEQCYEQPDWPEKDDNL